MSMYGSLYGAITTIVVTTPGTGVDPIDPVESPIDETAPAYVDHVEAAIARLAEQYKEKVSAS